MKILNKAVALLLTVLLAFSSLSVLASAAFDPTVDGGFDLNIKVKLFRNDGTDWVEVEDNKLKPGEQVKARAYVGTDYYANSSTFIFFYDNEFFTSSYTSAATTLSVNQAVGSVAKSCGATVSVRALNGAPPAIDYNGESVYTGHVGLMTLCEFNTAYTCPMLNINEWLFEYDLQVLTAPEATHGGIFALASTVLTPTNPTGIINVPKGQADDFCGGSDTKSMRLWNANVIFKNNDVFGDASENDPDNDSNFGEITNTITFDANGGQFDGGSDTVVKTGVIGTALTFAASVPNPTRENYTFVGWYPESVISATENDLVESDEFDYTPLKYMALWEASDVEITFDANGGKFSDNTDSKVVNVANGTPIAAPEEPTREGFTFDGWFDGENNQLQPGTTVAPTTETTYTARWTPVQGTAYKVVVHYHDKATDMDASRTYDFAGTTGETVNIVEEVPATPAANSVYHTFDEFALTNYELDSTAQNEFTEAILGDGTTVLNLYYKAKTYTATFDPNGGSFSNNTDNYEVQQEFYELVDGPDAAPTKTGYTFNGWNPTYTEGETRLLKDTTFTAQWTPNKYNAIFMVDNNQYYQTQVDYGDDIPLPPEPSGSIIAGYTFGGWTPTPGTMDSTNDKVFQAILTPIDLIVTFDANGGGFADSTTTKQVTYNYGDAIATPETPVNGSLAFGGWFTASGDQLTATTTMPSTNITYYAKWTGEGTHTATFNAGEGSFGTTSTKSADYAEGSYIGAPGTAVRDGYTFVRWETESGTRYEAGVTKMGNSNITFNAVWAKNAKITYNNDNQEYASFDSYEGQSFPQPENDPEKTGYNFVGWETPDGKTPDDFNTVPDQDVTFDAKFEAIDYIITYTVIGTVPAGAPSAPAGETAHYQDTVTVKAPLTFANYEFSGWNTTDATVSGGQFSMPAKNVTFTGSWSPIITTGHAVRYYIAVGNLYTTQYYEEGETIVPPANPTKEGMTFNGWTTTPDTATALPATMPANDINAYARWTFNKYDVTYMVDGAVYEKFDDVTYGGEVPAPDTDPSKEGMIFAGWTPTAPATMPAHDLTFTASWIAPPAPGEYTVTYYKTPGKTFYEATASEGDAVPTPDSEPTRFGYKFVGWEPEAPATMPAQNLEFTAKWEADDSFVPIVIGGIVVSGAVIGGISAAAAGTAITVIGGAIVIGVIAHALKNTHTVTYIVDGEVYRTYKVLAGTKIPVPDDPTKAGYKFKGWKPDVPERMPNNDLTFEAQFEKVSASADFPDTGSAASGITAFALISSAAAAAYVVMMRKRKEA